MGSASSTRRAGNGSTGRVTGPSASDTRPSPLVITASPSLRLYFGNDRARRNVAATSPLVDAAAAREATPPPRNGQLKVDRVDLMAAGNQLSHFTEDMTGVVDGLVVRRGKPVQLKLELSRPFDKATDGITLRFKTGKGESAAQRTHMVVALDGSRPSLAAEWKAEITSQEANSLIVSFTPSAKALVGLYSLSVHTKVAAGDASEPAQFTFKVASPVYVLFNAWCEDDQVYLAKQVEREEYVLLEKGCIWYGSARQKGSRPWAFDQFDEIVFKAVMYLLESKMKESARGNPALVARKMSAAVNQQDNNGVLAGRWDGEYAPHTRPTKWTGSASILKEYLDKKEPVRYGQCWVFSGVLTTVLRCLGIPCRSVTNYASAHDTDMSLTIDKYIDNQGKPLYSADSIWNFHVWNEAWMSRPDLPESCGGWQAVDATPQETSEGLYQTGPCSVAALKQGNVVYPNDGLFVFAEVNGDTVYWKKNKEGEWEVSKVRTSSVGKFISTKALGSNDRMDVTNEYKHQEGSSLEREAFNLAVAHGTKPDIYGTPDIPEDVEMSIQLADLCIGADIDIQVPFANQSDDHRTVSIIIQLEVVYYTGVVASVLKATFEEFVLGPQQKHDIGVHIPVDEYLDKLVEQSALRILLHGVVMETRQQIAEEEDLRLRTPDMDVKLVEPAADKIRIGTPVKVEFQLKNPLAKTLTNCEITVEGPGLLTPTVLKIPNIGPGDTMSRLVDFSPFRSGQKALIATFESDQLSQVTGEVDITVAK